ncbi:hypothetical protein R3P38DRAFT_2757468 [Favolaschia claudopus]|uniref:Uncharacterized protein n=1 Tax=Favolaschia claudopus TaxID=2862362 RepID=A0AAW0EHI0_9AGAR
MEESREYGRRSAESPPEISAPPPSPVLRAVDPEAEWAAMNTPPSVREMGPGRRHNIFVNDAFVNEVRASLTARRAAVRHALTDVDVRYDNASTEDERAACEKEKQEILLPAISGLERLLILVARQNFLQDMFDAYEAVAATAAEPTEYLTDVSNSPIAASDASNDHPIPPTASDDAYYEYLTDMTEIDEAEKSFERLARVSQNMALDFELSKYSKSKNPLLIAIRPLLIAIHPLLIALFSTRPLLASAVVFPPPTLHTFPPHTVTIPFEPRVGAVLRHKGPIRRSAFGFFKKRRRAAASSCAGVDLEVLEGFREFLMGDIAVGLGSDEEQC